MWQNLHVTLEIGRQQKKVYKETELYGELSIESSFNNSTLAEHE
jgi:hypothetical protein